VMRGRDGEGEDWWAKRFSQRRAKKVRNKKRRQKFEFCEDYGWVNVVEDGVSSHKGFAIKYRELNKMDCIQ
jgi:hypothetical protein